MTERHHFLISSDHIKGKRFELNKNESFHLNHVSRLSKGDEIFLLDLQGDAYRGCIQKIEEGTISGFIEDRIEQYQESTTRLHLGVGILKGTKMEMIVEKGTELGMFSITPLIMKYNVKNTVRQERLERIAKSAIKQCGRGYLPSILESISFDEWCSNLTPEFAVVTDNFKTSIPIWEWLSRYNHDIDDIWITVGPEGGYHHEEQKVIQETGLSTISLGPRRLKSETAAIAVLAICDNFFSRKRTS